MIGGDLIEYEVIVRYNGDILALTTELGVSVELLGYNYAIITSQNIENIDMLLNYPQIEYVEKPFILNTQDIQSFSRTGITRFKSTNKLTGKGTIIGVIDSGIDYTLEEFRDSQGNSKILYYWDQSINGNPPEGFKDGTLYTNEDINKAIKNEINIPISPTSTHGTHVAGIACQIASEANIIFVRVGSTVTDVFSKSTEFMRAIKFILDKALELKMPVAINISYGSNEGSHRGLSLFEQYIDDMCSFWKNNIIVAAGNNADKDGHKNIKLGDNEVEVEFVVGENEKILNLNIWPDFVDDFSVHIVNPSNVKSQQISLTSGEIRNVLGSTRVRGYFYPISPFSLVRRITIQLSSNININPGIWKLVFTPIKIVMGNVNIYLPTSEGISKDTRFLASSKNLTVTVPGTASKVITVGSFNSRTDTVSIFSGEGDIEENILKPDLLAPGEDILSVLPGGSIGALSGTSMATPHVTGVVALLMEWGIVNRNDLFFYSQKIRAFLIKEARRNPLYTYPNNSMGFGMLDMSNVNLVDISQVNQGYDLLYRKKVKKKLKNTRLAIPEDLVIKYQISHSPNFKEELAANNLNYQFYPISYDTGILILPVSDKTKFNKLASIKSIKKIDLSIVMNQLGVINRGVENGVVAREEIGANFLQNNSNVPITGRGVLIAIIDSGIDYLHEDFIYPDKTSKIVFLWDQTKDGKPPNGYEIGTEYTREDINKAIGSNDSTLSKDEEGNGTMLSGICSGLGNINKEYLGVAPESELIIVKLKKIDGNYNSTLVEAGVRYAVEKAVGMNMPIVINFSLGSNNLTGATQSIIYEQPLFTRGLALVAAAGNEGNTQTHSTGKVEFTGAQKDIELEILENEKLLEINIWVSRPDKVSVAVVSPSGEESKFIKVSNYNEISGLFDLEATWYVITYIYPTSYSGQQQVNIMLRNASKGIWKIRLKGEYITNGIFNAYLPNKALINSGTKFRDSTPSQTINYPATYNYVISAGAYNIIDRSIWPPSSRGPTINGLLKPDIVAPGVNIISTYPGNTYATITGTAPAAAHVSGAIALYFQYTLVDKYYPQKAFATMVRTFIEAGANRNQDISYPNESYGYGFLDMRGAFNQLK
ncbi:subtilisin-like serine germination related protease [[Clostridium] sordellii]|uniref:bifunctional germination protease/germinant receptor pseudoprotease CspBA n=1 Tax=Paraclostridium sordellii TaxID=1505 RepID=UPI0005E14343|nr:bifunctional germination protease/germinant receptor pseudoprotease CspBA [Paeniclostridium sordellii]MDU2146457.1 bifunctional germination protease/germinant receptor pseudoprotease CspBA [Paeniclostridium sordellii]CEQ30407.1 subtilisin-like serine germination related protease [[Clostridium] sordellii] [Paeniclostridium sordellii]